MKTKFLGFIVAILFISLPAAVNANFADEIKLIAADGASQDSFGWSVSISGNAAVVGAPQDGGSFGSAYIFERDPATHNWAQTQKLQAFDGARSDQFGESVSISGDSVIVGAKWDDSYRGSAYIFVRDPDTGVWAQQQKLLASDGAAYHIFGKSVAISGDTAIVGADYSTGIANSTGFAYIFVRDPATGVWTEQEKLAPSDGVVNDYFGYRVAIDGETAVVGSGLIGGRSYTYEYNSGTGNWDESKLIRTNTSESVGRNVSIQGDLAITGAPYITSYGSAYIFERNPVSGDWAEQQMLLQSGATSHGNFGYAVAIDSDLAVVGAYTTSNGGAAYAFVRDPVSGVWGSQKLQVSDGGALHNFGHSVSVDGDTVIVGAQGSDGVVANAGAAYVYTYTASPVPDITVTDSVAPTTDLSVPFGDVSEMTSADQTVTVTNDGSADLTLGNIAQANPLAAPFSILNDTCTAQTLTPAANCSLTVRFSPPSTGAFSDSFDIPSDDPDENPVTVDVNGTGIGLPVPDITVTDSVAPGDDLAIEFGNVTQATTSDEAITITNDGNSDLAIGNVAALDVLVPPFSILTDNCSSTTVAPAASCSLTIRFEPTGAGASSDSFDIPSDDSDEASLTFNLTGTGIGLPVPDIYSVGGNVSGLSGTGLVLQNNTGDDLAVAADGSFTFATALADGSAYAVTVLTQPTGPAQTCTVGSGSGTLTGTNVTNVSVVCVTTTFTVGGTVSGLTGSGLMLQNNTGDDLVVAADGSFTFATALADGSTYSITVLTQPATPGQTCTASNANGTITNAVVADIAITCVDDFVVPPPIPMEPVPTLSEWALILLTMLLGLMVFANRRRLF